MSDGTPTVQLFEGGAKHKVTDLPGWHEHPECVYANGVTLKHLHGRDKQPPHTHLPMEAWGDAVPLEVPPALRIACTGPQK